MLRVHYHPLSTFSQRVRIALLEKGIPAELVEVDLPGRAQFQPDYLARNPYGRVPAIDEDGCPSGSFPGKPERASRWRGRA